MATPPPPRQAVLLVNARSRRGREMFAEARRLLEGAGLELTRAEALEKPEALTAEVRQAVAARAPLIIVGGGDGSISSSVDELVGSDSVFALLPAGTANSFARSCGIPTEVEGAVEVIVNGAVGRIDLGMIDDDYFANFAAIGLAPLIAGSIPHLLKRYLGRAGYALWAALCFIRFRPFILRIDDERMRATEVRIANGSFQGGVELVENARPYSGEIVVEAVVARSKFGLLRSWVLTLLGRPRREREVRQFHARELRLETRPPLPISIDGEVAARTPVTVRVAAASISMMLPRERRP